MKQQSFERQHEADWSKLESMLDAAKKNRDNVYFANSYMTICQQLALAKQRLYDAALVERLNKLVMRLYRELYRYRAESRLNVYAFLVRGFPLALYQHRYFIALAMLVSVVPGIVAGIWIYYDDSAIYAVMHSSQVRQMEDMYDPAARILGRERESDTDLMMFGFYIQNNIGVAFRCFAAGLLAGVGTLFVLFFNGLQIGSVAGHLTRLDFVDTFYPFVVTHGAFELTAIVFSGAAGFRLGYAVLQPGLYSRIDAIKLAGRESIPMLYGIVLMLVIAAFIEAFWSSSTSLPIPVKYTVGSICWLLVLLYCFSARRYGPR